MKLFYTISLAVIISFSASGQNFRALKGGTEYIFNGPYNQVFGLRTDSVHFNGDSIYFLSKNVRYSEVTYCYDAYAPSWMGSHVVVADDGTHHFFNAAQDTITILSQAITGASWTAWTGTDGRSVVATVADIANSSFLGVSDIVKTITFQMLNSNLTPVAHLVNSRQLKISENFGMLDMPSFFSFPEHFDTYYTYDNYGLTQYELLGLSQPEMGVQNLTAKEIWDFQVGDTIQKRSYSSSFENIQETITQEVYLQRIDYPDSTAYTYDRKSTHAAGTTLTGLQFISFIHDTIDFTVRHAQPINGLPKSSKVFSTDEGFLYLHAIEYDMKAENPRIKSTQSLSGYQYSFDADLDCWQGLIDGICFSGAPLRYIEGCGGPYISCATSIASGFSHEIIYYNKGGTTWGTPIALSTNNISAKANFAKVYPNPAKDFIRVELPPNALPATISFFDLSGRILLERQVFQTESQIELTKLLPGFYTYLISSPESMMQSGKLVVR